jgi:hypothetical protein
MHFSLSFLLCHIRHGPLMLFGSLDAPFFPRFRRSVAWRSVRRCKHSGARGQPSTDPIRPQFANPQVRPSMEILLCLFLTADDHQQAGNRASRACNLLQIATKDLASHSNRNFSRGLNALTMNQVNSALQGFFFFSFSCFLTETCEFHNYF